MNNLLGLKGRKQWRKDVEETLGILVRFLPEEFRTDATNIFYAQTTMPASEAVVQVQKNLKQDESKAELKAELTALKNDNNHLQQELKNSEEKLKEQQQENEKIKAEFDKQGNKLNDKSKELSQLEENFAHLKAQNIQELKNSEEKLKELQQENEKIKAEFDKQGNKLNDKSKELSQLEENFAHLKAQNIQELKNSEEKLKELQQENEKINAELDKQGNQLNSKLAELSQLKKEFEHLKAQNMQDPKPQELEQYLKKLTPALRDVIAKYFDIENIHIFLIQCGQFTRITQCWEACARWILAEKPIPEDMTDFLILLGDLYNKGSSQAKATIIIVDVGTAYDYEKHHRVGQDGTTVSNALLPGLENAAGKIIHKPLVKLT